jgi:hypothetical protein
MRRVLHLLYPGGKKEKKAACKVMMSGSLAKSGDATRRAQSKSSVASVKALNDHLLCGIIAGTRRRKKIQNIYDRSNFNGKSDMSIFLSGPLKDQQLDFIGLHETIKKDYPPSFSGRLIPEVSLIGSGLIPLGEVVVSWVVLGCQVYHL